MVARFGVGATTLIMVVSNLKPQSAFGAKLWNMNALSSLGWMSRMKAGVGEGLGFVVLVAAELVPKPDMVGCGFAF